MQGYTVANSTKIIFWTLVFLVGAGSCTHFDGDELLISSDNMIVIFTSNQSGNYEVSSYNLNTRDIQNLTHHPGKDTHPISSPDGDLIAFLSDRDNANGDIFIMNSDGSNVINLTNDAATYGWPVSWSPDGLYIAFASDRERNMYGSDIFIMNLHDLTLQNLTMHELQTNVSPSWSPDGSRIAFVTRSELGEDIDYVSVINLKSQERKQIPVGPGIWFPSFSPNTGHILITSASNGSLYIVDDMENVNEVKLDGIFWPPISWSPDGESFALAFQTKTNENMEVDIALVTLSDLTISVISHPGFHNHSPAWLPDGKSIITLSVKDRVGDLFIVDINIGESHQLTHGAVHISESSWELLFGQLSLK